MAHDQETANPNDSSEMSVVDRLRALKEQRAVLQQRLDRLREAGGTMPALVLERVRADYERQNQALDQQAQPLKEAAAAEYGELAGHLERQRQLVEEITLEKLEIELRHQVGEFGDDQLQARLGHVGERFRHEQDALGRLEAQRELLVGVFDSPAELEALAGSAQAAPPAAEVPAPFAEAEVPAADAPSGDGHEPAASAADAAPLVDAAPLPEPAPRPALAAEPPLPADPISEPTPAQVPSFDAPSASFAFEPAEPEKAKPGFSLEKSEAAEPSGPPPPPPFAADFLPHPGRSSRELDDTMPTGLLPADPDPLGSPLPPEAAAAPPLPSSPPSPAFLANLDGAPTALLSPITAGGSSHVRTNLLQLAYIVPDKPVGRLKDPVPLEPLTSLGRTPQNFVQIEAGEISRHHAQIVLTSEGWLLRDLKSENGTFLNGHRIAEALLKEGDRLQLSTISFLFTQQPPRLG